VVTRIAAVEVEGGKQSLVVARSSRDLPRRLRCARHSLFGQPRLSYAVENGRAAFAHATPDRSTHLATKESASACANESDWRPSCEGGPKARQIGSRKDPHSDPSEFQRQAQAIQEVGR